MNVVRGIPCDRILKDYFQIGSGISQQFNDTLVVDFIYLCIHLFILWSKRGFMRFIDALQVDVIFWRLHEGYVVVYFVISCTFKINAQSIHTIHSGLFMGLLTLKLIEELQSPILSCCHGRTGFLSLFEIQDCIFSASSGSIIFKILAAFRWL